MYLDTSVVLARLFAEDRWPPDAFWSQTFTASRLLEYEVFDRIHVRAALITHSTAAPHLATLVFLHNSDPSPELATYDQRLDAAAVSEGFALAEY